MEINREKLYKWFATHPLFSINGMCKLVKIDTGNFSRYLISKKIPEKYIEKIEIIIKEYGYESLHNEVVRKFTDNNALKTSGIVILVPTNEHITVTKKEIIPSKELTDYEVGILAQRKTEIEKELKNPPPNPLIGKRAWILVRENELKEIELKLLK